MYCLWNVGETKIDRGEGNPPARSASIPPPRGQKGGREIPPPKINIVYLGDAFDRMENRDRRVRSTCTGSVSRPISTNVSAKVSGVRIFKHINTNTTGNRIYAPIEHMLHEMRSERKSFIELLIWIILFMFMEHLRLNIVLRLLWKRNKFRLLLYPTFKSLFYDQ